jgi:hypothetical protein
VWGTAERSVLALELGFEFPELVDLAASAHPRMDGVAPGAQTVVVGLEVEIAVEIQRRTIAVEFGAHSGPVGKNEIDVVAAGQQGAADRLDGNALRTFVLDPFDRRHHRPRPDRDAPDHFILHDDARDGRLRVARLHGEHPQKQGKQPPDSKVQLTSHHRRRGFAAKP